MKVKKLIPKKIERNHRDMKIRATYESMPGYKLQELADMFKCSVSSVWYAIHGRNHKAV